MGNGSHCIAGFFKQVAYNTTLGLADAAAPVSGESVAMTVCRQVGNAWSVVQGGAEVLGGGSLAVGGVVACGTGVLCIAGAPAALVGTGLATHGAGVAVMGTWQLVAPLGEVCAAASTGGGAGGGGGSPTPGPTPNPGPATQSPALTDVANARSQLGLPPRSTNPDDGYTVAILRADGNDFWGMNGGKSISFRVNNISKTHAEIDSLNQLVGRRQTTGKTDGRAVMAVGRIPCVACDKYKGIRSGVRAAQLDELEVIYPGGTLIVKP